MIPLDKRLHAGLSALATVVAGATALAVRWPLWVAGLAVLAVGAGRELAQWRGWMAGQAEWGDMAANVAGVTVVLAIFYGLGAR